MAAKKKIETEPETGTGIPDALVQRFATLFSGLEHVYGTHGTPYLGTDGVKWAIKKTVQTIQQPATPELIRGHLEGKMPIGIVPINALNMCVWGSIDIDDYDVEPLDVISKIEGLKLPLLPCRSKSGGLHLYIFMSAPAPALDVQAALRDIAAAIGFGKSEIFPKQTQIHVDKGDNGSWIILPYYGDDYGGKIKMQYGLKKTGAEMTLSEFVTAAERMRVKPEDLSLVRVKKPKRDRPAFSDGPPCLQHLADIGVAQGGQNNTAFQMAVYFKRAYPEDWQARLEDANHKFMRPPLPSDDLASVINSVSKKDYEYKCKDQPMVNHCDSVVCRGRKFGVGAGGVYPEIRGLAKLNTEPAVWFVDVEDSRLVMSTEELQNYIKFHRLCMEYAHKCFKMIRPDLWLLIVSEAMVDMEIMEAPPDVGVDGHFLELVEGFLTNSRKGEKPEDMFSGRPWEDVDCIKDVEQRHYFGLSDLQKHLEREGMKNMQRTGITERIKKLGGGTAFFNIKRTGKNVWYIPSSRLQRTPEIDPPEIKGEHI
jgi:hypothetical protein